MPSFLLQLHSCVYFVYNHWDTWKWLFHDSRYPAAGRAADFPKGTGCLALQYWGWAPEGNAASKPGMLTPEARQDPPRSLRGITAVLRPLVRCARVDTDSGDKWVKPSCTPCTHLDEAIGGHNLWLIYLFLYFLLTKEAATKGGKRTSTQISAQGDLQALCKADASISKINPLDG